MSSRSTSLIGDGEAVILDMLEPVLNQIRTPSAAWAGPLSMAFRPQGAMRWCILRPPRVLRYSLSKASRAVKALLTTVRAQVQLMHLAVLFNASKIPPSLSVSFLKTIRIAKRKTAIQVDDKPDSEVLQRQEQEAKATTRKRLPILKKPKPEHPVNPAEVIADALDLPPEGAESTPPGQDKTADEER